MEEYSVPNGATDVVIKCHDIREDESSLVVKFITTNEYLWVKYILNMEEDGTLAIDATYNTLKTLKTSACGCLAWVI